MGKQGPCYHCGVTSTPLWRNGPPEKPVLCNACGSRWRTKGSLSNYTPLHARAEPGHREDHRVFKIKNITINKKKEAKVLKRKLNRDDVIGEDASDYVQGNLKVLDDDLSNRSSSGSAISNSESCAQFGGADASDLSGQAQSVVWDTMVPSKKRTCVSRSKPSAVEKLTKDLCTILHEQQSSCLSGTSEEELLFEIETPMVSVEIGHGGILIRHPSSKSGEEDSEASSFSVNNKQHYSHKAYSCSPAMPVYSGERGLELKTLTSTLLKDCRMQVEQLGRDKSLKGKLEDLEHRDSPLSFVDLKEVINFEEFVGNLTNEEQEQLCTYLPDVDTAKLPESLKSMFDSHQFEEDLSSFQQLLAEGVFDISLSGVKTEDCKTLKRLALSNLTTSTWVERYSVIKRCKNSFRRYSITGSPDVTAADSSANVKRSRDTKNYHFSGAMTMIKSPKKVLIRSTNDCKENMESDGSCISPRSLFALPPGDIQTMHFDEESSEQDLLLEVPSNGSLPQAELLHPNKTFSQQASTSSSSMYLHSFHP